MIRFTDGSATCVQALGDDFGALDAWPWVALDQDDRTGSSADGETLRVNLAQRERFARLLFFVYIYEGSADFRRLGASVTVTEPSGPGCRILLDDSPAGSTGCAIALAVPQAGSLTVRREVTWFTNTATAGPHEPIDRAYGFGMEWTVTAKRPLPPAPDGPPRRW
ncbi:tellurium resistance protein [Streptomyces bambusae]|uniref:tellurium resistance protein n=1 Tax=Streptomyces bambusae TaxID=1550616 RepID=UPI0027E15DAF|nr:tellurium resistance protein [Streptomyces bambusae]